MSARDAVCGECGADDWEVGDVDASVSVSVGPSGIPSTDVEVWDYDVSCGTCGATADEAVPAGSVEAAGEDALDKLAGARVETTDNVRRTVVGVALTWPNAENGWVDEYGVVNSAREIRSVIHHGQPTEVDRYVELMGNRQIAGRPA